MRYVHHFSFNFVLLFLETKMRNYNERKIHIHCSNDQKRGALNAIGGNPAGGTINGKPGIGARKKKQ